MATPLDIDLPALAEALDAGPSVSCAYYLDRLTGGVEMVLQEAFDEQALFADVRNDPARYRPLPLAPAWLRRDLRRRFVEAQVEAPHVRVQLLEALEARQALGGFARLLRLHPTLQEGFSAYRAQALAPLAREWLASEKIRARLLGADQEE
ncbi:MAG: UPF0158 family protein [Myxococcales bacterium]|nr:UPF0158 family protein [Myxococcales bacterium]